MSNINNILNLSQYIPTLHNHSLMQHHSVIPVSFAAKTSILPLLATIWPQKLDQTLFETSPVPKPFIPFIIDIFLPIVPNITVLSTHIHWKHLLNNLFEQPEKSTQGQEELWMIKRLLSLSNFKRQKKVIIAALCQVLSETAFHEYWWNVFQSLKLTKHVDFCRSLIEHKRTDWLIQWKTYHSFNEDHICAIMKAGLKELFSVIINKIGSYIGCSQIHFIYSVCKYNQQEIFLKSLEPFMSETDVNHHILYALATYNRYDYYLSNEAILWKRNEFRTNRVEFWKEFIYCISRGGNIEWTQRTIDMMREKFHPTSDWFAWTELIQKGNIDYLNYLQMLLPNEYWIEKYMKKEDLLLILANNPAQTLPFYFSYRLHSVQNRSFSEDFHYEMLHQAWNTQQYDLFKQMLMWLDIKDRTLKQAKRVKYWAQIACRNHDMDWWKYFCYICSDWNHYIDEWLLCPTSCNFWEGCIYLTKQKQFDINSVRLSTFKMFFLVYFNDSRSPDELGYSIIKAMIQAGLQERALTYLRRVWLTIYETKQYCIIPRFISFLRMISDTGHPFISTVFTLAELDKKALPSWVLCLL